MASRRDELNAYNFARKRTVAAFLKPLPNGSIESAPRPIRTLVPTTVLAVLIVVGFGGCGLLKPAAPQGWNNVGEKVIVGDKSTTRYVVLNSTEKDADGNPKKLLHPVLNLASARLVLDPDKFEVVKVKEDVLDGKDAPPQGPTIGIPYAPDRLPGAKDAGTRKTWAVCEQPGSGRDAQTQRGLFVFADKDEQRKKIAEPGKGKVGESGALYVVDPEGAEYLVDHRGVAHQLDATAEARLRGATVTPAERKRQDELLRGILFGQSGAPQPVSEEWLGTLIKSPLPIFFPLLEDAGRPSDAAGAPAEHRVTGKILRANKGYYVVMKDRVAEVSPFVAKLLLQGDVGELAYDGAEPEPVGLPLASVQHEGDAFMAKVQGQEIPWPKPEISQTNNFQDQSDGRKVVCSAYYGKNLSLAGQEGEVPEMSTWAGKTYPAPIVDGSGSTYVTPGSGLLYREVTGTSTETGFTFLVTDTGLRYSVRMNNDNEESTGSADDEQGKAQIRLGYGGISAPPTVPRVWSRLLSVGPQLNTEAAKQPQGS